MPDPFNYAQARDADTMADEIQRRADQERDEFERARLEAIAEGQRNIARGHRKAP